MHVSIVGAGALGRIYGVRLAEKGEQIAFLVRPERVGETANFVIERVNADHRRDAIERPVRVAEVPRETQGVLVAVRFDQLDGALAERLRGAPQVPIVILTPLLPRQRATLEQAIGRRVVPGMPSASGYLDDRDVVRYWLPRVASTLFEEPEAREDGAAKSALEELCRRVDRAGIPAHLAREVMALNVATTTAFFPLAAAIDAGHGVDGVLGDKDLLATVIEAAHETGALAHKLGKVAPWAEILMKFVGPYTLKPGVTLARRLSPEAVKFVEMHFGSKLHAQHLAMGESVLALGRGHGVATPALTKLMETLRGAARVERHLPLA